MRRIGTYARLLTLALGAAPLPALAQEAPPAPAGGQPGGNAPPREIIRYQANNPREPGGDKLEEPRRLAADIVATDKPDPKLIVDVGSFTGEFLEGFMERFPNAHGQWTEPVTGNRDNAKRRFERFGDRLDYVIGCASRDISLGCVPKGVDVLLTSWLSIHQNLPGIQKFYKLAYGMLPSGGWMMNLDHVTVGEPWDGRLKAARTNATKEGLMATIEGPPVHHPDYVTPTLDQQLAGVRAAGFTDVAVVWRRLDTVLIMARKK